MKLSAPKPPLSKIIKEGCSYFCPICHSSAPKSNIFFGKRYCLNKECFHYYIPLTNTEISLKNIRLEKLKRIGII